MKVVVQRSKEASVAVSGKVVASIPFGLVLLIGFTEGDDQEKLEWMAKKIVQLRIFDDDNKVMNRSLLEVGGQILAISQFTLYADSKKGNRPSYMKALKNEKAKVLYDEFCLLLKKYSKVGMGVFGADMQVSLTNDGPITILLER